MGWDHWGLGGELVPGGAQVKKRSCVIDLPSYRKRFPLSLHRKWQKGRSASSAPPQPDDRSNGVSTMSIRGLKGLRECKGKGAYGEQQRERDGKDRRGAALFLSPPAGTPIIKTLFFFHFSPTFEAHTHTYAHFSLIRQGSSIMFAGKCSFPSIVHFFISTTGQRRVVAQIVVHSSRRKNTDMGKKELARHRG